MIGKVVELSPEHAAQFKEWQDEIQTGRTAELQSHGLARRIASRAGVDLAAISGFKVAGNLLIVLPMGDQSQPESILTDTQKGV